MKSISRMLETFAFLFCLSQAATGQTLPLERSVDWRHTGLRDSVRTFATTLNIIDFGGRGDSLSMNDAAMESALKSIHGGGAIIYFPAGSYLFGESITLPDSVIIRGSGAGSTRLIFDLHGTERDLFEIRGSKTVDTIFVGEDLVKGARQITASTSPAVQTGDLLLLSQTDTAIVTSSWAYYSAGQILRVADRKGDTIRITEALRKEYELRLKPRLVRIRPRRNVGIECLSLERLDATVGQSSNITIELAENCWISGVESYKTNFAHVEISFSTNILVQGSYFHHSHNYGGGGQGYGIAIQYASGECRVENNCFNKLRHSILLQAGANGNVVAQNYSVNPYWTETALPSNTAGDLVLHGNYVYANLFEGNICQNIVVDNSHGINGPFNTFFRNRAELYGIVMNSNPASDFQNFIGNEITGTQMFLGNYILAGKNVFEYGNSVRGAIVPSGTSGLPELSMYTAQKPPFWPLAGLPWPTIGTPFAYAAGSNPAKERYIRQTYTDCNSYQEIMDAGRTFPVVDHFTVSIYPNPVRNVLHVQTSDKRRGMQYKIVDSSGRIFFEGSQDGSRDFDMRALPSGVYFLEILHSNQHIGAVPFILQK